MIVFILLLLLLIGIVYFLSRNKDSQRINEEFAGMKESDDIYIGFKVYYSALNNELAEGDPNKRIFGYRPYDISGTNWNGDWWSYNNTYNGYLNAPRQTFQNESGSNLATYFQPLTNYPAELNKLKRIASTYNFNDNTKLLCKYIGRENIGEIFKTSRQVIINTINGATGNFNGSNSDNQFRMDQWFTYTYVQRYVNSTDIRYLLVATDWFVPKNLSSSICSKMINGCSDLSNINDNKRTFSYNITYYPLPPSNIEKCNLTTQNIALRLRKDYKIIDGNPLQTVDLSGLPLSVEDNTTINADCSSNIIDSEYLITRDISNAITKCVKTLETLTNGGIKYNNMMQFMDCKYLQKNDLPITKRILETNTGDNLGNLPVAPLNMSYTDIEDGIEFTFTTKSNIYNIGGSSNFYYILNISSPTSDISGQIPFIVNENKNVFPLILTINNTKKLGILSGEINAIPNSSLTQSLSDNFTVYNTPLIFTINTYPHKTYTNTNETDALLNNIDYTAISYPLYKSGVVNNIEAPILSNINTAMFDGTCEPDPKKSEGVEYCDAPTIPPADNKPFKLTRVQKEITPTSVKCTKPRLVIDKQPFIDFSLAASAAREFQYMHKQAHLQERARLF